MLSLIAYFLFRVLYLIKLTLTLIISYRLIDAKPNLHHAVHLAAIRKLCETSPLKLLQLHGKGSRKKAAAAERPPKSSNEPAGVLDFDSLEAMESPRSKLKNIDDDSTLKSLHSRYVVDG